MKDRFEHLVGRLEVCRSRKVGSSGHGVFRALDSSISTLSCIAYHGLGRAWLRGTVLTLVFIGIVVHELHTSALEAWLLPRFSARLSYELGLGPSPEIAFPKSGPYDERLGYSQIPLFQSRMEAQDFHVIEQVRMSRGLARLISLGIAAPYREPAIAGLETHGSDGEVLYKAAASDQFFRDFENIPPLLLRTLLFIENQELQHPSDPRINPVIDWDRLAKASLLYAGNKVGLPVSVQGGSTLATQLEKFRHSPRGRTRSAVEKLRQLAGASLKAYRDGTDTRPRRQEIIIDYLNSVPLSAVPGYGEVSGIGQGLYAWFGLKPDKIWKDLGKPELTKAKLRAYEHVLALLVSLPAPTTFLLKDRQALKRRVNLYTRLLEKAGIIDGRFADALLKEPIRFMPKAARVSPRSFNQKKASNAIRASLLRFLDVPNLYTLDRLHLEVESTIDSALQETVTRFFQSLTDPAFVQAQGLNQERMLEGANPRNVIYSLLLFERTPEANILRVQADNLDEPFDINNGVKLELGSTAKLRTLAHYLEVVALLYEEFSTLDDASLAQWVSRGRDPITRWAADTLIKEKNCPWMSFLIKRWSGAIRPVPMRHFLPVKGLTILKILIHWIIRVSLRYESPCSALRT